MAGNLFFPFGIGPGNPKTSGLPLNFTRSVVIIKLGYLSSKRDFSYVSDTVKGFINCIENKRCLGKSINLGTGMAFSMQETLDIIIKEIGKKANIEIEKKD